MSLLHHAAIVLTLATAVAAEDLPIRNSVSTRSMIEGAARLFQAANPGPGFADIPGVSAPCIKAVADGEAQMATVVRDLKEAEKQGCPDLKATPFCIDALVMVVHADNPVADLGKEQVRDIFTGAITSWKVVGGPDRPLALVARIHTFATLEFFEGVFGLKRVVTGEGAAATLCFKEGGPVSAMPASNDKAMAAVIANPDAITFGSLGLVNELKAKGAPVKALRLGGVEAGVENVVAGTYAARRNFFVITKGEPQGRIKDFLAFLLGPEGQKVVVGKGFIPMAK